MSGYENKQNAYTNHLMVDDIYILRNKNVQKPAYGIP